MFINTNLNAMDAQRNLGVTQGKLSKALQQLSSGMRINTAADDAAGYAISQRMQGQVNGMNQGLKNAQDGMSMIQTAAGALTQTTAILQRMRELTVQAGSSTLSTSDRQAIGDELLALKNEITNIGNQTKFNGLNLLTGDLSVSGALSGTGSLSDVGGTSATATIDASGANSADTYTFSGVGGSANLTLTDSTTGIAQTIAVADMGASSSQQLNFSALGVKVNLTSSGGMTGKMIANDASVAKLAGQTITMSGSGSAQYRVGANSGDNISVAFGDMRATAIGSGGVNNIDGLVPNHDAVSTTGKADILLASIDAALDQVSAQDSALGASQNQIQAAMASLSVSVENTSAAQASITNADVAQVSSQLVTQQILQQAGIAVLSQANTAPQAILKLLQ